MLIGLVLIGGAVRATPAAGGNDVTARVGHITVTVTGLRRGPSDVLTSRLQVTTDAAASDQLDAALAGGDTAVDVYHQRVSVGEIPDLASCDGETPPAGVVNHWLHYGPLLVPGRSSGPAPPASATLTIPRGESVSLVRKVTITLYFALAGRLTLRLPVDRA
jgi:hypothetical protein